MKNYTGIFFLLLLAGLTSCKKKEVARHESPDFQKGFSISSEFVDTTSQLEITIHLNDSLHAYAPGEKVGKPIKLEIASDNGWQALGPTLIPNGKRKNLSELGDSVVLEGDVRISQKVKPGQGKGEALLHLQVCTETVCDRPRVHRLPLQTDHP